jgi:hypothetical protein
MTKIFSDLPNWNFYLDEIAANVFEAIAVDKEGRSVSHVGTNLDATLSQCKNAAKEMDDLLNDDEEISR